MPGPLHGLKVVDFSRVLAGPLCGRTLADLGAGVIKIEPPRPDVSRAAFPNKQGMSGYYAQQNIGKRNLSIDLNVPGARDVALKLSDNADIVIENFRAETLKFFGLDYAALSQRNERLIYVSITGYGQGGPWKSRMAYAPTVQAESGFTQNTERHFGGNLGRTLTDPLSHADLYSGMQGVIAVLAALHNREKTGRGQYIDIAMAAVLLAVNERAHVDLEGIDLGAEPAVLGAADGPHFIGPAGERFVAAESIVSSLTFPNYLRAMRRADLAKDERFSTPESRLANYETLHAIIQEWIYAFSDLEALDAQLDEAKIAVGVVRSLKDLSETEWAEYWGAVREVPDRFGGTYRLPGHPWHFSESVLNEALPPAFQGEHNDAILRELGISDAEIEAYNRAKMLVRTALRADEGRHNAKPSPKGRFECCN